jgi:predicted small lipoprotein YifL
MKSLMVCIMCLSLASCGYQKPIVILPSDEAISDCTISSPPDIVGKDSQDKLILTSAWISQTNNLAACNKKLKMLQVWKRVNQERFGGTK